MLARFAPLGVREPEFTVEEVEHKPPLSPTALAFRGLAGALVMGAGSFIVVAALAALKTMRETPAKGFDFAAAVTLVGQPAGLADWVQLIGILAFAVIGGLFVAAASAARRGAVAMEVRSN